MLIGLSAGFVVLAHYLYRNPAPEERPSWAAGFFTAGLLGLITSVPIVTRWILPGSYNILFGEPALYLSVAFIGAAIALALRWDPLIPALYGFFAGLIGVIVGIRGMELGMTKVPALTGIGFLAAGLGGMVTLPAINWRDHRWLALLAAALLGLAAIVFLFNGVEAYWGHLASFAKWKPAP